MSEAMQPDPVCAELNGWGLFPAAPKGGLEYQPTPGLLSGSFSSGSTRSTVRTVPIPLGSVPFFCYLFQCNHQKLPFTLKNVSLWLMNCMVTQLIRKLGEKSYVWKTMFLNNSKIGYEIFKT